VVEKGTSDSEDIGFSLETLSALVAQKFSYSEVLVSNRDSFVSSAQKNGALVSSSPSVSIKSVSPAKLFISYSLQDKLLYRELETHLRSLQHQGVIEPWVSGSNDRAAVTDAQFSSDLKRLAEAEIILLLVSPSYLASDFLYGAEMKQIFEKHATGRAMVIPVLLKPCLWQETPLGKLQALPLNGKPVTSWSNQDEALVQVARGIQEAAVRVTASRGRA
jgi:hypothetical protein